MHKRHLVWAAIAMMIVAFVGCDDAPEEGRATIAVTLNDGNPISSDVDEAGTVFEDLIGVDFISRTLNDFITSPRGDVIVESYRITWERTDGGSGVLGPREETINLLLPVGEPVGTTIRLVSFADKTGPILGPLVGSGNLVTMRATVEFTAREVGTEAEVKTAASATVTFADLN